MKKELSYKGYYGSVEYSLEDDVLYGKVIGITFYQNLVIFSLKLRFIKGKR